MQQPTIPSHPPDPNAPHPPQPPHQFPRRRHRRRHRQRIRQLPKPSRRRHLVVVPLVHLAHRLFLTRSRKIQPLCVLVLAIDHVCDCAAGRDHVDIELLFWAIVAERPGVVGGGVEDGGVVGGDVGGVLWGGEVGGVGGVVKWGGLEGWFV